MLTRCPFMGGFKSIVVPLIGCAPYICGMERKILAVLFLLAIAGYGFFFFVIKGRTAEKESTPDTPMQLTDSTDAFSAALTVSLQAYYKLTGPLAKDDSSQVAASAEAFEKAVLELPVKQMKADSNLIKLATTLQQNMLKAAANMRSSPTMTEQRKQLQVVSDLLFDLLRTTQYKGATVYQQFCPMAFDNAGANWLSDGPAISNPYMGQSMPACGSVIDSISIKP